MIQHLPHWRLCFWHWRVWPMPSVSRRLSANLLASFCTPFCSTGWDWDWLWPPWEGKLPIDTWRIRNPTVTSSNPSSGCTPLIFIAMRSFRSLYFYVSNDTAAIKARRLRQRKFEIEWDISYCKLLDLLLWHDHVLILPLCRLYNHRMNRWRPALSAATGAEIFVFRSHY